LGLAECRKIAPADLTCLERWYIDAQPVRTITLNDFYIDQFEITNHKYAACVLDGACDAPRKSDSTERVSYYGNVDFDNYPVIYVSWSDADRFCKWRDARLPTEAEWEKAARGPNGNLLPWGTGFSCDRANANGCTNDTTAVGSYPTGVSDYSVYDMVGNVLEWVSDWYNASYYTNAPAANPTGQPTGEKHVIRGGSWDSHAGYIFPFYRDFPITEEGGTDIGFRCALDVSP